MTPSAVGASNGPVFVLSFHAGYRCGRSGVCCTSGWDIPVDAIEHAGIARACKRSPDLVRLVAAGAGRAGTWSIREPAPAPPAVAILARRVSGECIFFDRATPPRCLLQHAAGPGALPLACRQFPRIALRDDRGTHVTLSHYCPTAARRLFEDRDEPPATILRDPPGWQPADLDPGLDARGHWPPLLRPDVLFSLDAWSHWEAFTVAHLTRPAVHPFKSLARIALAAARVGSWRPERGPLEAHVRSVLGLSTDGADDVPAVVPPCEAVRRDHTRVLGCVPAGCPAPGAVLDLDAWWPEVLAAIDAYRGAVGRYLAARAFACWVAYQAPDLEAHVRWLRLVLATLLVEVARALGTDLRGRRAVEMGIRQSDLVLLHLADSRDLATLASGQASTATPRHRRGACNQSRQD